MYCNKNQEGYKFELSQKALLGWGLKKDSYYKAVKELQEKHFLVPITKGSSMFYFYENAIDEFPHEICEAVSSLNKEQYA